MAFKTTGSKINQVVQVVGTTEVDVTPSVDTVMGFLVICDVTFAVAGIGETPDVTNYLPADTLTEIPVSGGFSVKASGAGTLTIVEVIE